jgi:hypothetical protein
MTLPHIEVEFGLPRQNIDALVVLDMGRGGYN